MELTTSIDAVRGDENIFDLDANVAITVSDDLAFTCYHRKGDTAVISKTDADGITITDGPNGKFQVVLDPADTVGLTVENTVGDMVLTRALIYRATVDQGGGGNPQQVCSGVMYLVD